MLAPGKRCARACGLPLHFARPAYGYPERVIHDALHLDDTAPHRLRWPAGAGRGCPGCIAGHSSMPPGHPISKKPAASPWSSAQLESSSASLTDDEAHMLSPFGRVEERAGLRSIACPIASRKALTSACILGSFHYLAGPSAQDLYVVGPGPPSGTVPAGGHPCSAWSIGVIHRRPMDRKRHDRMPKGRSSRVPCVQRLMGVLI